MLYRKRWHTCISVQWLLFLVIFMVGSCTAYRASKVTQEGVYYFQKTKIGGVPQSLMVRGDSKDNPVMLFLHGGPGYPLFPLDQTGEVMRHMEESFTMVYWEQRGTGRSFSWRLSTDSMTLDRFVSDTREVVEYTRDLLGAEKVFVWGHSWGSNVGALFAAAYPEYLHAYVSTGQSVHPFKNERLCYEFVYKQATLENNRRALRELERVDTLPDRYGVEDALLIRRWVQYYGGIVKERVGSRGYIDVVDIYRTMTAPQYALPDRLSMVFRPYFSITHLWDELKTLDLEMAAPRMEVPVFFLLGRHDIIVSSKLAEQYFESLEAPYGKTLVWFEKSAHRPHHEEMEKFLEVMRQELLPLASP